MIIIEDGSIVPNANSYISRDAYIDYAEQFGIEIEDEESADIELIKAFEFINSQELRLKGRKVSREQYGAFPRKELIIDGFEWDDNEIPEKVKKAQMAIALEVHQGIDVYNRKDNLLVKRQRIEGAVEVEYMEPKSLEARSVQSEASFLLRSLMKPALLGVPVARA